LDSQRQEKLHALFSKEKSRRETKKNEGKEETADGIVPPPNLKRGKGLDNDDIWSNSGFKFEEANNNKELTAKNNKNKSSNDAVKTSTKTKLK
jgi:hypothetical protein